MSVNELYKKYRPQSFKEVLGQNGAVSSLIKMGKANSIPHTILFTGPSGCGKTTLARILRNKLHCSDRDFHELNAAESRGIEMVRDIQERMSLSPIGGKCRIWLIDECHQLTPQAQESFLKILEDTPAHVYFFLASTNPGKLRKTFINRCTEIRVKELPNDAIVNLVSNVSLAENAGALSEAVSAKISELSEGSARRALVLLHQIIELKTDTEKIDALQQADTKRQAVELCRALLKGKKPRWKEITEVLKTIDEEPETIRWMVLGYMNSVALKSSGPTLQRAIKVIDEFRDNFFDSKKVGLTVACYHSLYDLSEED